MPPHHSAVAIQCPPPGLSESGDCRDTLTSSPRFDTSRVTCAKPSASTDRSKRIDAAAVHLMGRHMSIGKWIDFLARTRTSRRRRTSSTSSTQRRELARSLLFQIAAIESWRRTGHECFRTEACRGPAPNPRGSARYENRREFQFGWNVRRATTNSAACQHSIDDAQPCAVECLPPNKSAS